MSDFLNTITAATGFFNRALIVVLMHPVKYRDSLPWAVQKQLNWSTCSLGCWVRKRKHVNSPQPISKSIGSAIFAQLVAECHRRHWRHLANTIEQVLPSAHLSPQPKQQIDRFSHFCTAHGRMSPYFTIGAPFPQKLPLLMGGSGTGRHLIHDSLGKFEPTTQMASSSVQPFLHRWLQCVSILYNWPPLPQLKNCPFP